MIIYMNNHSRSDKDREFIIKDSLKVLKTMFQTDRIWFNAYKHTYELLHLRGYLPSVGSHQVDIQHFSDMKKKWDKSTNYPWYIFNHPEDPDIHAVFANEKLNIASIPKYIAHIEAAQKQKNKSLDTPYRNRVVNFIIIYNEEITNNAMTELAKYSLSLDIRQNIIANRNKPMIETFDVYNMQINPLKFVLQPKIFHIKDEATKEQLRLRLIRDIAKKNSTLDELLPRLYFGNPIAAWYGAKIGDVFRFERSIGGFQGYYRIVVPPLIGEYMGEYEDEDDLGQVPTKDDKNEPIVYE